jgi:hypothetical protein
MRAWLLAGLLLVLAGLLHLGLASPTRARAWAAQDEYSRTRGERQRLRVRRLELERRHAALEKIAPALTGQSPSAGDPVNDLRLVVLAALKKRAVSDVQLSVGAGRPPVGATARLSAAGRFSEVILLCDELVRPGSGIVLERLRLSRGGSAVVLDLQGLRLSGG